MPTSRCGGQPGAVRRRALWVQRPSPRGRVARGAARRSLGGAVAEDMRADTVTDTDMAPWSAGPQARSWRAVDDVASAHPAGLSSPAVRSQARTSRAVGFANASFDLPSTSATYHRRGNLLSWGQHTFTWDTLGRMTSMQGPGIHRSMFYDANGERIVVRDGSSYTFTLRDLGQQVLREVSWSNASSWTWGRDYIYRGGTLLASQSTTAGEGLRYHFPDHLTSARLVTNRCGERAVEHRTSSFGLDLPSGSAQSADRMRFTMHERDLGQLSTTLDDLDVMHARTYWPSLGRFTSVDPGRDHDPKVPQSWNLYAYVRGNPLNSFDPDGRDTYLVNRFLSGDFLSPLLTGRSAAGPNTLITHTFIAIVDERGMVTKTYSWGNEPDQHNALAEGRWFADEEEDLIAGQQSVRLGLARKVGEADLDPYVTQAFARVANRVEDPSNHPNRIIADNCKHEAKKLLQAARRLQRWDEVKKRRGEREEKRVLVKETEQKHER